MSKPQAVIFDMDGTLADVSGIRHHVIQHPKDFDAFHAASVDVPPHQWVADAARAVKHAGHDVVIVTARTHKWRHHTAWFLALNDIPSDALFMRANSDQRPDVDVKRDILATIRKTWDVVWAFDDNPSIVALWRDNNIPVTVVPGWKD